MLLLLTRIISTATPRLQVKKGIDDDIVTLMTAVLLSSVMFHTVFQVLAAQCLTALCASAGGGDGCAVAEQPEIDVLLEALLSPCFSVRDAALRVSYSSFGYMLIDLSKVKVYYRQKVATHLMCNADVYFYSTCS